MGNIDFSSIPAFAPFFFYGAINTVLISVIVVFFSFILAFFVALMRNSKNHFLKWISLVYVEIIRGTPMLLQIMLAFLLIRLDFLPFIKFNEYQLDISLLFPGLIALIINSTAYLSETIRAGLDSVPKGQIEAACSEGLRTTQTFKLIILPQAIKTILPAIGNEFVTIIKDSSLLSTIGVFELMHNTEEVRTATFQPLPALLVCALIYFILTFSTTTIIRTFEKKEK